MATEKYLIDTVVDALKVLRIFMENLSPAEYYSAADIERISGFSTAKVYRILKTLEHCGLLDQHKDGRRYKIGHELLMLSHRRLQALYAEHQKIKAEIESFDAAGR